MPRKAKNILYVKGMSKPKNIFKQNNSVFRITASYVVFDWSQPYNTHNEQEGTGTGFVIDEICLLNSNKQDSFLLMTAYHVVEDAKQILVRIESMHGSQTVPSKLIACNPDLDVAVVSVPVKLPEDIEPLKCGDSDLISPLDEIQALGYALGKEHLNYTTGVISARTPSAIQIDAAINPGNSGGPVLHTETGLVLGVVISGYNNAQNMNFACPIKEAVASMTRVTNATGVVHELFPHIGAKFVTTSSALLENHGLRNGCMCTHIRENSKLHQSGMRTGDIVTKIQGYDVQYDGTIRPPFWKNPLSYKSIIYRGAIDDEISIEYYSAQNKMLRQAEILLESNKNVFREMWPEFETIRYCTKGGVVAQPLVANIVNPKIDKQLHWKFHNIMKSPVMKVKSLVIITHLQADCPFKKTPGTLAIGDVITRINDIVIHEEGDIDPFDQYVSAWERLKNEKIITIHTRDGNISSIKNEDWIVS